MELQTRPKIGIGEDMKQLERSCRPHGSGKERLVSDAECHSCLRAMSDGVGSGSRST